jgi:hypothetical protein
VLMTRHSPQKSYFVGVGRSSTALVAFMENLGTDVATYLPADGLHRIVEKAGGKAVDAATKQEVFRLFDAFLPRKVLEGQRSVVLFQRSETGASLPFLQGLLTEYLMANGATTKVSSVALSDQKPAAGVEHLDTATSKELRELNSPRYLLVAPYGYFRPGKNALTEIVASNGTPTARSGAFETFKTAMRSRMAQDHILSQRLLSLFPAGTVAATVALGK